MEASPSRVPVPDYVKEYLSTPDEEQWDFVEDISSTEEEENKRQSLTRRDQLYVLITDPMYNWMALIYMVANVGAILLSSGTYLLSTLPAYQSNSTLSTIEAMVMSLFTLDYLAKLMLTRKDRIKWIRKTINIIDLLAILPFYLELVLDNFVAGGSLGLSVLLILRILRLFRVIRLLKMVKYSKQLPVLAQTTLAAAPSFLLGMYFLSMTCIMWASLVYFVETLNCVYDDADGLLKYPDGNFTQFQSIPHTMWWTLVTLATVGYGDMVPETPQGKFMASLTMLCGSFVLAYPMTILSDTFNIQTRKFVIQNRLRHLRKEMFLREKSMEARTPKYLLLHVREELSQFQEKINNAKRHVETLENQFQMLEDNVQKLHRWTKRLEYAKSKFAKKKKKDEEVDKKEKRKGKRDTLMMLETTST